MTNTLFPTPDFFTIPVQGETAEYPVLRIFCVGRNYAAHAEEMGYEVDREAPFYFAKNPLHTLPTGASLAYPPATENFHYEMELALAIGKPVFRATKEEAADAIYGYCCALDMTRRDLQLSSRAIKRPWMAGKDVEGSAVFAPMTKATDYGPIGDQSIHLELNGETKQHSKLSLLIHDCVNVIVDLSKYYHLQPGDVIMTGTPEGVGPVVAGDVITGGIDGLAPISLTITEAE